MKKLKLTKIIASSLVAVSALALNPIGVSAEWKQDSNGWWYTESDSYATGWKSIDGKWYYFDSNGYMAHDTMIGGYQLGADGTWAQDTAIDTVVATIGDEKITKDDLDKAMKSNDDQLKKQYGNDYATNSNLKDELKYIKQEVLTDLVTKKIILKKAVDLNIKPSDDEINKQITDTITRYNGEHPGENFESAVQKKGITIDEAKQNLKDIFIISAVQNSIGKAVSVTDEEAKAYYDKYKDSKFTVSAGADVEHILVANEEDAKRLKGKLDSGADFATLARENSIDPGTKQNGGDLGYITYDSTQYVPEFMNGFKNLKNGEISEPVKSQFGYHIIRVTGLKDAGVLPFDEAKDKIKAALLNAKQGSEFEAKLEEWKNQLNVKFYSERL